MSNHQIISKETHRNYRIITDRSDALGDGVMHAMTFPMEFRALQSYYPILCCKHADSEVFYPAALFGLEQNENLFLENDKWNADYVPMMIEMAPFLIGFEVSAEKNQDDTPVVAIDMDSPRVNLEKGQPLFDENGEPSGFLKDTAMLLDNIHRGNEQNKGFIEALLENNLLESCTIKLSLVDGSGRELREFYSINESNLSKLSGTVLEKLNSQDYLEAIFMMIASLSRVSYLIDKKNVSVLRSASRPTH